MKYAIKSIISVGITFIVCPLSLSASGGEGVED